MKNVAIVGAGIAGLSAAWLLASRHRPLREWRRRFHGQLDEVRALAFDDRFVRMWDFYLAICEAAFLERHTGVLQMLLVKNGAKRRLYNEPWGDAGAAAPIRSLQGSAA